MSTPLPSTGEVKRKGEAPARGPLLSNMQVRTLTILTLGPLIVLGAVHSLETATALACLGLFLSELEYDGLQRHMKANLLLQALHQGKSAGTVKKEELPPMLVRFSEKTYPYPVTGCTNRAALTRAAAMMVWGLLAYMGPVVLGSVLAAYILVRIAPVVVRAVFTEEPPPSPSHASLAPPTETPAVTPVGTSKKAVQLAEYTKMRNDFLVVEEYLIRRLPTLNALLSLVLELFGVLWTLCIVTPLLIYAVPGVGRPWGFAALCGNFVNDIAALLIGKTLRYLREIILVNTGNGGAAPSGLYQFILNFPHPLCPRVSPNKSLEGAIAGVLANSVSFYLFMKTAYRYVTVTPPNHVFDASYNQPLVWLAVGAFLGVCGVCGDLLQSFLKRVARVKDAGFLVPGHGGALDRLDGMLINFLFLFLIVQYMLYRSG